MATLQARVEWKTRVPCMFVPLEDLGYPVTQVVIPFTFKPAWPLTCIFRVAAYVKESLAVFSCWGWDPDWHSLCSASTGSFQHEVGAASRVAADSGCGQHHRAHRGRSRPDQGTGRGGRGELPLSHLSVILRLTLPSHLHIHGHLSEWLNKTARPARWGGYQMVLWPSMSWFFSLPLGVIEKQ